MTYPTFRIIWSTTNKLSTRRSNNTIIFWKLPLNSSPKYSKNISLCPNQVCNAISPGLLIQKGLFTSFAILNPQDRPLIITSSPYMYHKISPCQNCQSTSYLSKENTNVEPSCPDFPACSKSTFSPNSIPFPSTIKSCLQSLCFQQYPSCLE